MSTSNIVDIITNVYVVLSIKKVRGASYKYPKVCKKYDFEHIIKVKYEKVDAFYV